MTQDLIEQIRDILTVMKLSEEVNLDLQTKINIQSVAEEYLKALLPK